MQTSADPTDRPDAPKERPSLEEQLAIGGIPVVVYVAMFGATLAGQLAGVVFDASALKSAIASGSL